jgi:uncharacterized glyoxalase superfamily protein PhnB
MDVYPSPTRRGRRPRPLRRARHGNGMVMVQPDEHYRRAPETCAEVLGEPHDAIEGRRRGYSARDPEGNLWSFGIHRPESEG